MHTIILLVSFGQFLANLTTFQAVFISVLFVVLCILFARYVFKINKMSNDLSEMVRLLKKMSGEEETKDTDNQ